VKVTVVFASANVQDVVPLTLAAGATVGDAVARSGLVAAHAPGAVGVAFAVWGRRATADRPLQDGDRVEITQPLQADPKQARRRRADAKPLARPPSAKKRRRAG
jgi:putative ubiquitin-RnfH superfamily antitoxin RatB of RatAB toxin-antitoxin module